MISKSRTDMREQKSRILWMQFEIKLIAIILGITVAWLCHSIF